MRNRNTSFLDGVRTKLVSIYSNDVSNQGYKNTYNDSNVFSSKCVPKKRNHYKRSWGLTYYPGVLLANVKYGYDVAAFLLYAAFSRVLDAFYFHINKNDLYHNGSLWTIFWTSPLAHAGMEVWNLMINILFIIPRIVVNMIGLVFDEIFIVLNLLLSVFDRESDRRDTKVVIWSLDKIIPTIKAGFWILSSIAISYLARFHPGMVPATAIGNIVLVMGFVLLTTTRCSYSNDIESRLFASSNYGQPNVGRYLALMAVGILMSSAWVPVSVYSIYSAALLLLIIPSPALERNPTHPPVEVTGLVVMALTWTVISPASSLALMASSPFVWNRVNDVYDMTRKHVHAVIVLSLVMVRLGASAVNTLLSVPSVCISTCTNNKSNGFSVSLDDKGVHVNLTNSDDQPYQSQYGRSNGKW